MTVKDFEDLFEYSSWANTRLFEVFARLTPEQFTETVAGSYGSIRNTMVHVLSAEWGWVDRCGGAPRGPALVGADYPTLTSLVDLRRNVEAHLRAFLAQLRDEDLDRLVEFTLGSGPKQAMRLGDLMHHAAIHGVHHRGQVALLLRLLGQVPGNFDILFFYGRPR
jgi:uncharacterized damage-inducible protein DinB